MNVARVQEGDYVLIYQGTSCASQFIIQLANEIGAEVFVMTTSASKGEFLKAKFSAPSEVVFYDGDNIVTNKIQLNSHGKGIDVVFESLVNVPILRLYGYLVPFGHIIDTILKTNSVSSEPRISLPANISWTSVNMAELLKKRLAMACNILQQEMRAGFEKQLKPPHILYVFGATDLEAAFCHFQDHQLIGKYVIKLAPGTMIMVYAAKAFVNELKIKGVNIVIPEVGISNMNDLKGIIRSLANSTPLVRGCIQATLTLRNNFFENMSYDDWVVSTHSKVTGSNLHRASPSNLDFFILLSSLNGIFGSRGQANYGARNTFKYALAHYRISHGQRAVSLNLDVMVMEGIVAESEYLLALMRRIGLLMDIYKELLRYYSGNANSVVDKAELLKNAPSEDEAASLVTARFSSKMAQVLELAESDIDPGKPVHTYGIDSLAAIDLRN
ncbi:KR domain-containing protein [Camillea tinctor]|nr:KR domain-containing protein [Camillea tinctor]